MLTIAKIDKDCRQCRLPILIGDEYFQRHNTRHYNYCDEDCNRDYDAMIYNVNPLCASCGNVVWGKFKKGYNHFCDAC